MKYLETEIWLPPGVPSRETVREVLRLIFDEFSWFTPVRYGYLELDNALVPGDLGRHQLLAFYQKEEALQVGARTNQNFINIFPATNTEYVYTGSCSWLTSPREALRPAWRDRHVAQVKQLMLLLGSPLASAALKEDFKSKTQRLVEHETFTQLEFNVRGYGEGLAGLFWRNFYGPPFVSMFGERLTSLPPDVRRDLGDGIVLVEPYALPSEAGTDAGRAREAELIAKLGPECFYDHARNLLPTRRPILPPVPGDTNPS